MAVSSRLLQWEIEISQTIANFPSRGRFALALAAFLIARPVGADWSMDPARSSLSFVSIKAKDVAEVQTFTEMSGSIAEVTAQGSLSLHGETQPMVIDMQAAKVDAGTVMVASTKPLVIDAAKFGMSDGVEKLREIAGLDSISNAVPVTFVMTFVASPGAMGSAWP